MKEEKQARMRELDQELEDAIDGEQIQLSVDVIQARLLLCVHRAGCIALTQLSHVHSGIRAEERMFTLVNSAYHERAVKLKSVLKQFDKTVEDRIAMLAVGRVYEQLVELLGKDAADALVDLVEREEGTGDGDAPGDSGGT